ncbi:MAG: hypothetical protein IJZ53_07420 [Tyzzerella sp.]|nr:hypothetical protein [Tyzzerella sp.]
MIWRKAANIVQIIGGAVAVCALLMVDNISISTEYIAQKVVLGCVIVVVGLFWENILGELQHARYKKRICRYRDKGKKRRKKKSA